MQNITIQYTAHPSVTFYFGILWWHEALHRRAEVKISAMERDREFLWEIRTGWFFAKESACTIVAPQAYTTCANYNVYIQYELSHSKIMRFDKKISYFRQSVLNKIWILTFSTMEILNPKVGTVPKKIREIFMANKSPRTLFSVMENRVCFGRRLKTIIKII